MDEAFIVVSIISGVFGLMGLLLLDRNWFRREKYKFFIDTEKKKNDLQFKKMRKELGLDMKGPSYRANSPINPLENITGILGLLKNLDSDKIGALAGLLGGNQESEGISEGGSMAENLLKAALENPKIVEGISKMMSQGGNNPPSDEGFI